MCVCVCVRVCVRVCRSARAGGGVMWQARRVDFREGAPSCGALRCTKVAYWRGDVMGDAAESGGLGRAESKVQHW